MTIKALAEFLLSPFSFITLAMAMGLVLLLARSRDRVVKSVYIASFLLYYFFSIWPVANFFLFSLEGKYPPASQLVDFRDIEAIVVLAGDASRRGGLRSRAELNEASWRRLWYGVELYDELQGGVPIFFIGESDDELARGLDGASLVAKVNNRWGIPNEHFLVDQTPGNTYTSGLVVQKILDEKFPGKIKHKIVLVTSAWHMPRAAAVFKKLRFEVIIKPCDWHVGSLNLSPWSFFPNQEALSALTLALREWLGIAAYKINGYI